MIVKYNIMSYLIGEGFKNLFKNKKSTSAALTIMCLAMFMFGIFFVVGENINYVMEQVESEQGMKVWLKHETNEEQIKAVEEKLRSMDAINTVEYVSNEETFNQYRDFLGKYKDELDGIETYFQDAFLITLTDLSQSSAVKAQIEQLPEIDEVNAGDETIETLINITKALRIATLVILVILILIAIFIITNTIKLTVHARRKEISIMKYVGATNSFIRWPFIVEGIIIGLISAFITIFIVGLVYNFVTNGMLESPTFQKLGLRLYTFRDMFNLLLVTYVLLGAGIGIVGSSISMRKYLEV